MISIVVPAFNEEDTIPQLVERLQSAASAIQGQEFEFIIVDDCSSDQTPFLLENFRLLDSRFHTIRFARNCGSHAAIQAGLSHCRGEAAIVMAADLQDPPELIQDLMASWKEGNHTVWAVRNKREGESFKTLLFAKIYYALMKRFGDFKQPPGGADCFLIDRVVIDRVNESPEKNTSILMLISWLGFRQAYVPYVKEARIAGASKWNFSKRIKLAMDSILSFSQVPLRWMSGLGVVVTLSGFVFCMSILVRVMGGTAIEVAHQILAVVLLLSGLQMMMLGLLGEYLWRTYDETRSRPNYVIEKNTIL